MLFFLFLCFDLPSVPLRCFSIFLPSCYYERSLVMWVDDEPALLGSFGLTHPLRSGAELANAGRRRDTG